MLPPRGTMSSGWLRASDVTAPLPFGWKLCLSVVPKTICLTESAEFEAVALELALAVADLGLELGWELELELELEPEHPAVLSSPAATTATPRRVVVRTLKVFITGLYATRVTHGAAEFNAQANARWPGEGQILHIRLTLCRDALCPRCLTGGSQALGPWAGTAVRSGSGVLRSDFCQPCVQEAALGAGAGEGCRLLVGAGGFFVPAKAAQEVSPGRGQQVVAGEGAAGLQVLQYRQSCGGAVG